MPAEILDFPPLRRTTCHELHAPDGRWWCASTYLWPDDLAKLRPGRDYTPGELVRLYGLPTYNGRPGLPLREGEELPATVRYVVINLVTGERA